MRVPLTERQREIVRMLMRGLTTKEMLMELGVKPRTLKAHFNRLFLKFGIDRGYVKRVRLIHLLYEQSRREGKKGKR
jgi:DNA-binding CsgD family transcriptional regulator